MLPVSRHEVVNVRMLRLSFLPVSATVVAAIILAIVGAYLTGYSYTQDTSREGYVSMARSLAAIFGAGILAAAVITQSLRTRREQIEQRFLAWLDRQGEPTPERWNPGVELALEESAAAITIGPQGAEIRQSLLDRKKLAALDKYSSRLFVFPLAALAGIVAVALWAIPASEEYLDISVPAVNTALVFLTSYGSMAAVAAMVATMILTLRE